METRRGERAPLFVLYKNSIGKKHLKIPKRERPSSVAAFFSARVQALQSGASHSEEFRVAYTSTEFFVLFCVVPQREALQQ